MFSYITDQKYNIVKLALVIQLSLLMGCQWQAEPADTGSIELLSIQSITDNNQKKQVEIKTSDLDMSDQLHLYNLDYQLRMATLSSIRNLLENKHNNKNDLSWNLNTIKRPEPIINVQPNWTNNQLSLEDSTAKIDVLCSYASRPCAQIMSSIEEFNLTLDKPLNIRFYDFPQNYHHLGRDSANAVSCIEDEAKEQLKEFLWIRNGQLDMESLTGAIDLYSKKPGNVYTCMASRETEEQFIKNYKSLKYSGFSKTPSILYNGEYLSSGFESKQLFTELLPHMLLETTDNTEEIRNENINYLQSWKNSNNQFDWALLEHQGNALRVSSGNKISGLWIAKITDDNVSVVSKGKEYWLNSKEKPISTTTVKTRPNHTEAENPEEYFDSEDMQPEHITHEDRYNNLMKNLKPQSLPQAWLEEQLIRQDELEDSYHLTESKIDGKSLVKLNKSDIDDFYKSLGMQAGDVIVRVNNEWIHEDNNVLFQTLSNDKNVDISIMRNGFPVHFSFNITE